MKSFMAMVRESARSHGKAAGMWAPSFARAKPWLYKGVRFIESAGDIGFIARGAAELMSRFPGHGPRLTGGGAGHI